MYQKLKIIKNILFHIVDWCIPFHSLAQLKYKGNTDYGENKISKRNVFLACYTTYRNGKINTGVISISY